MGVPSFFKWLAKKYPKILSEAVEFYPDLLPDGSLKYPDTSKSNPNGVEYDCLYLDMNGIIHPCTHPEGRPAPPTEDAMLLEIFAYVDRLFNIVRPRRLIYFAIDGVAPRAKMNQQRTRRFKSAKESKDNARIQETVLQDLRNKGIDVAEESPEGQTHWDRNQITPGTPFMERVAQALRYFIIGKLTNDAGWANVTCILSDSNVPGEGEHKLMEYIRYQHSQPGYNANTRHCICGLDADLIMLGLATHEPHFTILRENVLLDKRPLSLNSTRLDAFRHDPFQFLNLSVMREYLEIELKPQASLVFEFDLERAIDDFVFICFLVGNDFLPHIPSLEIRDEAITTLTKMYRELLPQLDGFLTNNGTINFERVLPLFRAIAALEDEMLRKKREKQKQRNAQQARRPLDGNDAEEQMAQSIEHKYDTGKSFKENLNLHRRQLEMLQLAQFREKEFDEDFDPVRLGEPGWRARYYKTKFGVDMDDRDFFLRMTRVYSEGLQWVLKYYYQGCVSWDWYYPYHYAPFIAEVSGLVDVTHAFDRPTEPFRPYEQLLAVLPPESSQFLPSAYAELMTDEMSKIKHFYPEVFEEDYNGKPFAWQAIALLPFIDEALLKEAIQGLDATFTPEEHGRNRVGETLIYCSRRNPLANSVLALNEFSFVSGAKVTIDSNATPFFGSLSTVPSHLGSFNSRFQESPIANLPDLVGHEAVYACYHHPPMTGPFQSKLRDGLIMPAPVLNIVDINKERLHVAGLEAASARLKAHITGKPMTTSPHNGGPMRSGAGFGSTYPQAGNRSLGLMGGGLKPPAPVHPRGSPYAQQHVPSMPNISPHILPPPNFNNSNANAMAQGYAPLGGMLIPPPLAINPSLKPPPLSALNSMAIPKPSLGSLNAMPSLRVNTGAVPTMNNLNMLPSLNVNNVNTMVNGQPFSIPNNNSSYMMPISPPPLNFINTNVNPNNIGGLPNPYAPNPLYSANVAPNRYANLNHNLFNPNGPGNPSG